MILHLEQVNQLRHTTALLYDLLEVEIRVANEFVDGFLIGEHTVLVGLAVLEHTKVGLSRHEESLLNDVDKTEAEEVQRDVHEVRGGQGHESEDADLVTDDL